MKRTLPTTGEPLHTAWQVLGELKLPVEPRPPGLLEDWLTRTLQPLGLPADFFQKVSDSARAGAARVPQADHLHLCVLVPSALPPNRHTWGFFRIEKLENATDGRRMPDHSVELYLYLE